MNVDAVTGRLVLSLNQLALEPSRALWLSAQEGEFHVRS